MRVGGEMSEAKPVAWIIYRYYTIEKERLLDDDVLLTENIGEDLDRINKYEQPNERWWAEVPLYNRPQKPLTDDQIDALVLPESGTGTIRDLVRIIEAAHGIGRGQ